MTSNIITPLDIEGYSICPYGYSMGNIEPTFKKDFSLTESAIAETIKLSEKNALLKDNSVTPRSMLKVWDRVWWPAALERGLSIDESRVLSGKVSTKLSGYCKYDISDFLYPTAGVDIVSEIKVGDSILRSEAKIIKVNLENKKINTVIVEFNNKDFSARDIALSPYIRAKLLPFCDGVENIHYVNVNIGDAFSKIKVSLFTFREDDIKRSLDMVSVLEEISRKKIVLINPLFCKECNKCPNFSL